MKSLDDWFCPKSGNSFWCLIHFLSPLLCPTLPIFQWLGTWAWRIFKASSQTRWIPLPAYPSLFSSSDPTHTLLVQPWTHCFSITRLSYSSKFLSLLSTITLKVDHYKQNIKKPDAEKMKSKTEKSKHQCTDSTDFLVLCSAHNYLIDFINSLMCFLKRFYLSFEKFRQVYNTYKIHMIISIFIQCL